jgi:hypothetical protein
VNFKFYIFLTRSISFTALFLLSSMGSYTFGQTEGLSTFRFKIIDKTANKDLAVSKVNFPQGTINGEIATIKAKDTIYGSVPITIGKSALIPGITIFAITNKKTSTPLFVYLIAFKENQNDKLTTVLTSQFTDDVMELLTFGTNKATIITPTAGIENPIYDATLQIDSQNVNKSKILSLTSLQKERLNILGVIKDLAPSLYQAMIAADPNGINHIVWNEELGAMNISVLPSNKDGLPVIYVGSLASQIPREQLKFIIAHELGHYALDHFSSSAFSEEILEHAFSRSTESEADRFAIMQLGANIDDAIAAGKTLSLYVSKRPSALQSTHPFWQTRIEHFNELRRELEARRRQPQQINWKELVAHYLKKFGSK